MKQPGSNGNGHHIPSWDCGESGHHWIGVPGGPAPYACQHCPAIGAPCPECRETGTIRVAGLSAACTRCRETGRIELCEVTRADLDYLVLTGRRLKFLLEFWAGANGDDPAEIVAEIDRMIAGSPTEGKRDMRAYLRAWRAAHRHQIREDRRAYYQANREHELARGRARRDA